jgi:hypothetical protein
MITTIDIVPDGMKFSGLRNSRVEVRQNKCLPLPGIGLLKPSTRSSFFSLLNHLNVILLLFPLNWDGIQSRQVGLVRSLASMTASCSTLPTSQSLQHNLIPSMCFFQAGRNDEYYQQVE